jgi:Family of unknown function (DUF6518)
VSDVYRSDESGAARPTNPPTILLTSPPAKAPAKAPATLPLAVRVAIVFVVGLGVGAITSLLQGRVQFPWLSLVDAASPWLTPMFVLGMLWRRSSPAAVAGLATGLCELVGYYATASARGYAPGHALVIFWALCAVVGGPAFGWAGWQWWNGHGWVGALGASALPAAFFAEAVVVYAARLGYWSSAALFALIGVAMVVMLGLAQRRHLQLAKWLLVTVPLGVVAELVLGLVYNQSF